MFSWSLESESLAVYPSKRQNLFEIDLTDGFFLRDDAGIDTQSKHIDLSHWFAIPPVQFEWSCMRVIILARDIPTYYTYLREASIY